ncbi:hypothetical protein RvY_05235 [Ramazzottius varieornatus]|uniref:28S ribosomal protein S18a, mitochondrial n=1 Tax=Ramazzottius varieornatus TaxID=947166 RepID=A0A1D1UUF0_RAMVA|nr:hypothetical protein RvY_05235 [Ramazzottius varieornatus]
MASVKTFFLLAQATRTLVGGLSRTPTTALTSTRSFWMTPALRIKHIEEKEEGDVTVIEANYLDHHYDKIVVKGPNAEKGCCPLCDLNLPLKYTDVLIIQQFLKPGKGTVLHRYITGLCAYQQANIDRLAYQAGKAGLLKKVFMKSTGTKTIMPKKPGHRLPRHYAGPMTGNPR